MKPIRLTASVALALALGAPMPAAAEDCGGAYTVRAGDTLSGIAARCDIDVEAVLKANPDLADPGSLSVGQELTLPTAESTPGAAKAEARQESYTVRPGDSFAGIAAALDLPLDALLAANPGVEPQALQPGQKLNLPAEPAAPSGMPATPTTEEAQGAASPDERDAAQRQEAESYTVKLGDSMAAIAAALGISLEDLMDANPDSDPRSLQPGQKLALPVAEPVAETADEADAVQSDKGADSETGEQPAVTGETVPAEPESPPEPVRMELAGRIVEGVECPVLVTADGRRFGLVSQEYGLFPGAEVTIRGEAVAISLCKQAETIRILSMEVKKTAAGG